MDLDFVSVNKHAKKNSANIPPSWPHAWSITHISRLNAHRRLSADGQLKDDIIYSGAPAREARQPSTMGKKCWETHEGKKICCVRPPVRAYRLSGRGSGVLRQPDRGGGRRIGWGRWGADECHLYFIPTYVRKQSLQLWSIDSCQIKVSADQYHVAISRAHTWSSSRSRVFVKLTADQMMVF